MSRRARVMAVAGCLLVVMCAALYWGLARQATPTPASQRSQSAGMPANSGIIDAEGVAAEDERATDRAIRDVTGPNGAGGKAAARLAADVAIRMREEVMLAEDKVFASMPSFEERRDEVFAKARAVIEGMGAATPEAIATEAQAELDRFWSMGGLAESGAYEHAYMAEALLKLALEKEPESFALLDMLKEAMATSSPSGVRDRTLRNDPTIKERLARAEAELSSVIARQRALVMSGTLPPSPEAMLAVYDSMYLAYRRQEYAAGLEDLKWLAENAEACGCGKIKPVFDDMIAHADSRGSTALGNLHLWPAGSAGTAEGVRLDAINARRLPSFRGSPQRRAEMVWLWNYREKVTSSRSVR